MNKETIDVLDNGYVRLVDRMGNDLSVVNAARASFLKESDEFGPNDAKLLRYLIRKNEWSPFRHAFVSIEVKAPLMVARQWFKYVVGSDHTMQAWNEASRRYITMEPEFYVPAADEWRSVPENKKQGSGAPIDIDTGRSFTKKLIAYIDDGLDMYNDALNAGVAPEQARLLLPAYGMHTVWRWSSSINSVAHFLTERIAEGAQNEITQYAEAVRDLVIPYFPVSLEAFKQVSDEAKEAA